MKKAGIEMASTVIAAVLVVGGCVSKGEYEKLQAERDGLEQKVKDLESRRSGLRCSECVRGSRRSGRHRPRARLRGETRLRRTWGAPESFVARRVR